MDNPQNGRIAKVRTVSKLEAGMEIPLSDWQIACSDPDGTINLAVMDVSDAKKDQTSYTIRKGAWRISPQRGTQEIKFQNSVYYETETSSRLRKIFSTFKQNLHVYDELGLEIKKRGVLLGSEPGVGKSALINNFCSELVSESDACVLFIDNENVDFEIVQKMFRDAKKDAASFIVLVIEDIGGSDLDSRNHHIDSTLLNFLDGQEGIYKIPTLIIGTTNYLDKLQKSVNSRPGRFDIVLEVTPPGEKESEDFVEKFLKRELSTAERNAIRNKKLTPAYLRECVIRHKLDSISFVESVEQILKQRGLSEEGKHKSKKGRNNLGFGDFEND